MKSLLVFLILFSAICVHAQVKIGDNPGTIDAASILELEDTGRGLLVSRMTTAQRDAIISPPDGLQVYNTTTKTIDVYRNDQWESTTYTDPNDNLVYVYSLDDLPAPSGSTITLDANSMYIFKGIVDISPYYLELNGANLRGIDPSRDGVSSTVSGAILRSTNVSVFMENLVVIPLSGSTKAYDFSDATGTQFCNLFSGCSVIEIGIPSLGVGQISGFKAATISKNYWNCTDGLKVTGTIGKFACLATFITNIATGAGIEFLSGLVIDDIDLSNNYFVYSGQSGVKLVSGAQVDRGRLTTNMFRGVTNNLDGLTPYDIGWHMLQNTDIQDTRVYGLIYMNDNSTSTDTSPDNTYVKVAGTTTSSKLQKFVSNASNQLTYKGKEDIVGKVFVTVTGKSPGNGANFTLALSKNGTAIPNPHQNTGVMTNNQGFVLILATEVDMVTDDYIEVIIKTTTSTTPITLSDLQFRVED